MQIGEKLSYRRKELQLTQEEVCKGICSITYLSKLEHNKIEAKEDILSLLCQRLNLDLEDLMKDDFKIYMDRLRTLYKLVINRNLKQIEQELNHFQFPNSMINPTVLAAYEIILFEYYIISQKTDTLDELKKRIHSKKNHLTDEIFVWYYKSLGLYEYTFGDVKRASEYFYLAQEFLDLQNKVDAHLDYLLGLVNSRLMLISRSIMHTEKALEIYTKEINIKKIIDCKLMLGVNYNKIEQYTLAEQLFLNMAENLENINDKKTQGMAYHNLGFLYSLTDQRAKALSYYQRALDVKPAPELKLNTIYLLAYEHKKNGDLEKAKELCELGLQISDSTQLNFYFKLYILKQTLEPYEYSDDFVEKLEHEIIPYFLKQDPLVVCECYYLLGKILADKSKYKSASFYYEKALELNLNSRRRELLI